MNKKTMVLSGILFVALCQVCLSDYLTRENTRIDVRQKLYHDANIKYFFNAERIDKSVTRSIDVGFCINYLDSAGAERNRVFTVPSGDKYHRWEFIVNEDITVYCIEALRLTDNTHKWDVWISEEGGYFQGLPKKSIHAEEEMPEENDLFYRMASIERYNIDPGAVIEEWAKGESILLDGFWITRLEGENRYQSITNIAYKPMQKRIREIEQENTGRNMEKDGRIKFYRNYAKGGVLILYIRRDAEWKAEKENFILSVFNGSGRLASRIEANEEYPVFNPVLSWDGSFYHNYIIYWIPDAFSTRESRIVSVNGEYVQEYSGRDRFWIEVRDKASENVYRFQIEDREFE